MSDEEKRLKRTALWVCAAGSFLVPYMSSSVIVALPAIGREFGTGAVTLSWVTTAFILSSAILMLPVGRLADIHGRKLLFMIGLAVYTLASGLAAISHTAPQLITARVLQGIGGAMTAGANVAILTAIFPPGDRGRVLGINVAAVYVGISVGPFLGGVLTQYAGWRSIFFLNLPLGLVLLWLLAYRLPGEWAGARGEKFDLPGSVIFGAGMLALMLGFTRIQTVHGAALAVAGVAGLAGFLWWEARAAQPMLDVALLRDNRVFLFSGLAALINYCATAGSGFLLSLYLQYVKGLAPREAGMVLLVQPVFQTLVAPFAGRLSDRIEPRIVASVGMALNAAGLALLIGIGPDTPLAAIIACLILMGAGFGAFSSPNTNAIMSSVDRSRYGVAAGTVGTMRVSGQVFSMGIVTVLLAVYLGSAAITPESIPQFITTARYSYAIFAVLCTIGVFASLARGRVRPGARV